MGNFDFPSRQGPPVDHLLQRQELFEMIRESHLRWMNETDDQDMKEAHRALAASFESILAPYDDLLDALQRLD